MRSSRLIRRVFISIFLVVTCGAVAYFLDPDRRLQGLVNGYPTFQGRSASAWRMDLNTKDDVQRSITFDKLKNGKADAVPVLVWVLRAGGQSEARWHAADVLGQIGVDSRIAANDLIALLDDADPYVKTTALKSLSRLAPKATEPLPPELGGVVTALVGKFPELEAIRVVADYKRHGAEAVPKLTELLTHPDAAVRWNAARTLGKIGEPAKSAIPAIIAQFTDDVSLVREHAAEALGDIGPVAAESIPYLVKALQDKEWKVRKDAVRSLGQIGAAAKSVLPQVQAMKSDPEAEVREKATDAERKIDPSLAGKQGK